MRRVTYLLSAASFAALMFVPAPAQAQTQEIENLRRRVEEVERQLFQQRLSAPMTPHNASVERLQMRLDQLERELASQRISDVAASVTATSARASSPASPLAARIEQLESALAENAKTIEKLTARLTALEKAAPKPRVKRRK